MKKCLTTVVILVIMCLCFSVGVSAAEGLSDTQVSQRLSQITQQTSGNLNLNETKIAISSVADLKAFRNRVNNGESSLSAYLTCDIDLNNENWMPIGTAEKPFRGSFNGYGHLIFNLYCHFPENFGGLFGCIEQAFIQNIVVIGKITNDSISGGIVGVANNSVIANCGNLCNIYTNGSAVGGIVGFCSSDYDSVPNPDPLVNASTIIGCYNDAYIMGLGDYATFAGGISGMNAGYVSVINCYNTCTVGSETGPAGGIVGSIGKYGFIGCTYSIGEISESLPEGYGEICGIAFEDGMIANSYYYNTGYPAININQSTAVHSMHYVTNINDLTTNAFISALNQGNTSSTSFFVADTKGINSGFPIMNWEKPLNYHWSEGITLDKTTLNLKIGESYILKATLFPSNVSNKKVDWLSLDPDITSVDDTGKVTALNEGTSTITALTRDGCCYSTCTVIVTKNAPTPTPTPVPTVTFSDVSASDYFYDAVNWAVAKGVTNGVGPNQFGPNQTCLRSQVVTFLWRAAGCPEPKSSNNPFTDVKPSDYFYKAVLWAVENKITSGISANSFGSNLGCTRGQVVTFLWRANGQPGVTGSNPFTDVRTSDYYYSAVLWAVQKGITNGMSATIFAPDATCIRGQIVTFLYRNYN